MRGDDHTMFAAPPDGQFYWLVRIGGVENRHGCSAVHQALRTAQEYLLNGGCAHTVLADYFGLIIACWRGDRIEMFLRTQSQPVAAGKDQSADRYDDKP